MNIQEHYINEIKVAEVLSDEIIINNAEDALDLMANIYYQGFDKIIFHQKNITSDFFDLKNQMAGEILQKFSNYRIQLVVVGDFSGFTSKSLKDFIYESNNGKQVNFLSSTIDAINALTNNYGN